MTSPANPPKTTQAPSTAATSVPSYASAAGASKKPGTIVASGSHPSPPVVVGSSAPTPSNAKPGLTEPVNGRPAIPPSGPGVSSPPVVISSNANGAGQEHRRDGSVTIAANGPATTYGANGGPVGGNKAHNLQFHYSSPHTTYTTPQLAPTAPVPIPSAGNNRVASPAQSPSPIPQPSASGGRPPSGLAQSADVKPTFGSLPNDEASRHMKGPQAPNPAIQHTQGIHNRQPSNISMASTGDMPAQNMQPRGNYHGGRGRGGFNPAQAQYNPNGGFQQQGNYGNGRGRGNMPPAFQPGARPAYPNSPQPQPARASPHPGQSHPSTPQMGAAMPVPPGAQGYGYPPMPQQPVRSPSFGSFPPSHQQPLLSHRGGRGGKKIGGRGGRDQERQTEYSREANGAHPSQASRSSKQGNNKKRNMNGSTSRPLVAPAMEQRGHGNEVRPGPQQPQLQPALPLPLPPFPPHLRANSHLDLSPEHHNFERIQAMLTEQSKQNMPGYPPYHQGPQYGGPMHMGNMAQMGNISYAYGGMPYGGQANTPGYGGPYPGAPPFHPGAPVAMSRTPSSSEKPGTPSGPGQPVIVGTPNQSGKNPSASFTKAKSSKIIIKRPDGEPLDLKNMAAPASPALSLQQSKTPPVVTSSSTPPSKPSTPAHSRSDSHAPPAKRAKEVQDELRAKIAQATKNEADNKEAEAKAGAAKEAAAEKKVAEEKAAAKEKARLEAEAKAKKEADEKAAAEKAEADKKAADEAKKVEEEAKRKLAEEAAAKDAEARKKQEEEDEMERMIREMEEEDKKREEEQERITAEKKVQAAKDKAEKDKKDKEVAAENDRKLREQEREMERLEDEKEKRAQAAAASGVSVSDLLAQSKDGSSLQVDALADKVGSMALSASDSKPPTPTSAGGSKVSDKTRKPAALNLSVNTKGAVDAPQPSAAMTSLKTSRFLSIKESLDPKLYTGLASPNPAINSAVGKKGQSFKYDAGFLLQFQGVFTEQPSEQFSTQVKTLIGENDGSRRSAGGAQTPASARQPSRTGSGFPGGIPFGNFTSQQPSRTLPPGTTSSDRFAMSQGGMNRPPIGTGMSSFGPGGGFPRGNMMGQMGRQPSSSGMNPNSPRQGSNRGGRGGSQRSGFNANHSKNEKNMPLTQGQDLKALSTSSSGWKPASLAKGGSQPSATAYMDPPMVQRKVQGALNKMTPENFDRISDSILTIADQSKQETDGRTLRQVIQLTFEKATDEPHFSSTYAKFCKRMLDRMSAEIKDDTILDKHGNVVSGGNLFRKYLLNRCQEEFEKGWSVAAGEDKNEPTAVLLSEEYYQNAAVKRRGLGLVRFIGELYKLGMLTERIITGCIHGLIDYKDEPKEAEIESLCFLMRTVGQQLEATEKGQPMMQVYFDRIQKMIDLPHLENRLKFMLMDVRDLRDNRWQSKEANKGPKTLQEIRIEQEAAALAKAQEAARSNHRGPGGRGGPGGGRGDNRNFSGGYNQSHQNSNTVGMDDLRRLKSSSQRSGLMTLGPQSMLASRSNSGRRGGPGGVLGRTGDDSGPASRTGTPPTQSASSSNAYGLLASLESENPTSPPSTAASPSMSKVTPDTATEKKD